MAKKSKTQRAKASANRAQKKLEREQAALAAAEEEPEQIVEEPSPKRKLFRKKSEAESSASTDKGSSKKAEKELSKKESSAPAKSKKDAKPKKKRFQFFRDVKAEMKRVTWPTRTDVLRWSGVVIVALIFFGVFVAVLDNFVITPVLVFISSLGGAA